MHFCDILFITSDKTEGGIQRALIDWASVILENRPESFGCITPENRFSQWLARYHPRAKTVLLSSVQRRIMRQLPWLSRYSLSGYRAKIAFVHNGFACKSARYLASQVIGVCHNDKPLNFKAADYLICLTPRAITLAKQQGWTDDRLVMLPHYHDCHHVNMPALPSATSLRVSAAGRFVDKKNFGLFVSIAAAVQAKRPEIHFTLAGDGPLQASLRQMAADKGARIEFIGWADINKLASQTHLFILPSTVEPFGYVLAEIMDSGTAVLSTPTSGADYLLDGGRIAPLIEASQLEKWVETILFLADDNKALTSLRINSFEYIRHNKFSRPTFINGMNELLNQLRMGE